MLPEPILLSRRGALLAGLATTVPLAPPARPALYVLGDSWAAGLHADPRRALGQTAAAALGWTAQVDAVSGTGYATATAAGGAYPERLRSTAPDGRPGVAVLQGGSNDRRVAPAAMEAAVAAALDALAAARPAMRPLLLGPGPDPEPVDDAQREVDSLIGSAAVAAGVPWVSMLDEDWIPATLAAAVIDPTTAHPSTAGQAYLGRRLAAAVRRIYPSAA